MKNLLESAKTSPSRSMGKSRTERTTNVREAEFQALAKKLPTLSDEDRKVYYKNLAPGDRAALVGNLIKESDPSGRSDNLDCLLTSIIEIWVNEDFEGAWAWSLKLENDSSRRYMVGMLLDQLDKKDPARALDLYVEVASNSGFIGSNVPYHALTGVTLSDANNFIDFLGKMPLAKGGGANGLVDCEFAKDFDFQRAADGTLDLQRKNNELPKPFPSNFIEAWAERDPNAAFAWLANLQQVNSPYFTFDDLLEGIEKKGIPGDASAWVAKKIEQSETFRKVIIEKMAYSSPAKINGVTMTLSDSSSRDRFLTDLLVSGHRSSNCNFINLLSEMSSPQARLEAFSQIKNDGTYLSYKILQTQYQAWGITRQQIEAIFPPATEP